MFSIPANKLRFYEKKNLLAPRRDESSGYRVYTKDDLTKIQLILTYRLLDMPIDAIKSALEAHSNETLALQIFEQMEALHQKMNRYRAIQTHLNTAIDSYLATGSKSDLQSELIRAGVLIGRDLDQAGSWEDKWNFDSWAKDYDLSIKTMNDPLGLFKNYEKVLESVFQTAQNHVTKEGKFLEIGVGTGHLASKFLENNMDITGVDQSKKMLLKSKQKYPHLKVRMGTFLSLPFETSVFDCIVSTYAFHHLTDQEKTLAIREMKRVLKPQGHILIGDMMFVDTKARTAFIDKLDTSSKKIVEDEYYTNIRQFEKALASHGLTYKAIQIDELMHQLHLTFA